MSSERPDQSTAPAVSAVAFFGKITASVTHELNNVVSIIEQNAGLLDDLVAGEERGVPISLERLSGVAAAIQKQSQRGLQIIARLNRFAHSTDAVEGDFDLNAVIGNLIELSRRPAGLKRVELAADLAPEAPHATGNPLAVQMAVFGMILAALERCPAPATVRVGTRADGASAGVMVECPPPMDFDTPARARLQSIAEAAGASITIEAAPTGGRLILRLATGNSAATPGGGLSSD